MSKSRGNPPIVIGISGASGGCYAVRLVAELLRLEVPVALVVSRQGLAMLISECGLEVDADGRPRWQSLWPQADTPAGLLRWYPNDQLDVSIASGSRPSAGMVVCPASLNTVGALAAGMAGTLMHRAAQVALKERRKLVIVLRETPLATLHLEKLVDLSRSGAVILPAIPAFYDKPQTLDEVVDFVVARILDQFALEHHIGRRWQATDEASPGRSAVDSPSEDPTS